MDPNEILSIVFGDLLPERWKGSDEASSYVDDLSSLGVDKLSREPDRLQEEKTHIVAETRDLAFHNYKTFIETAECSKEVFQDFQSVEQHLDGLLDRLPEFGKSCQSLSDVAKDINARRRVNSLTLARHTQLLEILEIPQLMDTCVRNNYYEEALELSSYVRQLRVKYNSISIVADIVSEVDACSQLMLQQLLQQLRGSIQLPACLKIIGYLRRLEVFSEVELRLKFLQARDCWFQSQVNSVPSDNAYQHSSKIIEVCRVYIFDVITQYRAVFPDDSESMIRPLSSVGNQQLQVSASGIFHSWLVSKISWFLSVLRADLKAGVSGRLDSLLGQCMYFGLSLGRIGTDFRSLLPVLFQEAALRAFQQNVDGSMSAFRSALSHYTLASSALLHAHSSLLSSTLATSSQSDSSTILPPNQLLEFPPLATLSNGLMSALNELRPCAPLAVAPGVVEALQRSLLSVSNSLQKYHQTESSSITSSEAEVFGRLCNAFAHVLVPLVQTCLERLFPAESLQHAAGQAAVAGLETSDFIRALRLDVGVISAPLADHLSTVEVADADTHGATGTVSTGSSSSLIGDSDHFSQPQAPAAVTAESDSPVIIASGSDASHDRPTESSTESPVVITTAAEGALAPMPSDPASAGLPDAVPS